MYGGVQLLAAPAGKTGRQVLDNQRLGGGHPAGRLVRHCARDEHPPGTYECGRLGPTGNQPSGHELDIEPLPGTQFRPVPGLTTRWRCRRPCEPLRLWRPWPFCRPPPPFRARHAFALEFLPRVN